jgi:shikimate dehydrogenase
LASEVRKLRGDEFLGANVTVPHKEAVMPLLDGVDSWTELIGAANTIVNNRGRLLGYNTDADGFIRALGEHAGMDPRGKRVLMLGAGGSARAAAFALAKGGVASIAIANRTLSRAESLARDVRKLSSDVTVVPMDGGPLESASAHANLIVNCTSMGMLHGDAQGRTPIDGRLIPPDVLVYDMVYNPPETLLLREARAAGAETLGGLAMLIYQGAASFERWTGKDAPIEVMFRAAERALVGSPTQS